MHSVSSISVSIASLVYGFPVRVHARSEATFSPVGTRRIRKEVFGREVEEISVFGEKEIKIQSLEFDPFGNFIRVIELK